MGVRIKPVEPTVIKDKAIIKQVIEEIRRKPTKAAPKRGKAAGHGVRPAVLQFPGKDCRIPALPVLARLCGRGHRRPKLPAGGIPAGAETKFSVLNEI